MCELMAEPGVSGEPRPLRDASVDEEEVCFVCMEPCSEASRCACTDRNVHQECMLKWLRTNNTTECPVCKVEYPHVDIERKVYKCPATACLGMALGCITFVAFLVCGSLQLAMYLSPDFVSATLTLAVGMFMIAVATVGLVICCLCGNRFRLNQVVWDRRMIERVVMRQGPHNV